MAEDTNLVERSEQPRVKVSPRPRDKPVIKEGGYRIIEQPTDRNPEVLGRPKGDRPAVFFNDRVYRETTEYLGQDLRYERGGLFFGYRNRAPQGETYTEVTEFFPATHGHGTEVEFRIANDDFAAAMGEVERRGKGEQIIGWVHSHPHHPPAPSEHRDFWIMKNLFQDTPEHFTLIMNPNTREVGLFRWEEGRSVNQSGFILYGELPEHGVATRPRVIHTNSLSEREAPMVKVKPETLRQRLANFLRKLTSRN